MDEKNPFVKNNVNLDFVTKEKKIPLSRFELYASITGTYHEGQWLLITINL